MITVHSRQLNTDLTNFCRLAASMTKPKYLTGDNAAINEFIDQFDVS